MDMCVDGPLNRVYQVDGKKDSTGDHNPHFNGFYMEKTLLGSERQAVCDARHAYGRHWVVESAHRKNYLGQPTGYRIMPGAEIRPLNDMRSSVMRRAPFLAHQLWVTSYHPMEKYPGGSYPNQRREADGISIWVNQDRNLVDSQLVVWHVFGVTHGTRVEDWPIMNAERCGFSISPCGFFDVNPCLDVPPQSVINGPRSLSVRLSSAPSTTSSDPANPERPLVARL